MTKLAFWKMHGAGNDFLVAEPSPEPPLDDAGWARLAIEACDRHKGVGADGLILVLPSDTADRRMRIINADGSEAEMCVNGIRCFVKYCLDRHLVDSADGAMTVETLSGIVPVQATRDAAGLVERVRLTLAPPDLNPAAVGVQIEQAPPVTDLPITVSGNGVQETFPVTLVSMGNPHAVRFIDEAPADYPLLQAGPLVERHPIFANRTNYEVIRVRDRAHLDMRVWERGVGETQACGSGACAAVVAARIRGVVDNEVDVTVPGGTLHIEWTGDGPISLSGPTARVFEAVWER
ncbi:MAG: diaminopimelate epimerase [Chloroflexi bacterium]|nr:diaminopimelate epimerase [Chloroflexota bacterium]MQC82585.1 diaminopimelate epimerase [Chloroflexota bacterium]MQC83248.1 diaminopimelate epimerase [Chloroflexota bacterium]